jgi:membrane-associated phospholipid phosphatase
MLDSNIKCYSCTNGYGMPGFHTLQTSLMFNAIFIEFFYGEDTSRRRSGWLTKFLFSLIPLFMTGLVAFSRLYMGTHSID